MEGVLAALEAVPLVQYFKTSRWGYMGLNAAHILAVAVLVGAMVPLNLVRLGLIRSIPREAAARLLVPVAGVGLALAMLTGFVLFSTRAGEYAGLSAFRAKLVLVAFGALTALTLHGAYGALMQRAAPGRTAIHAALSLATWVAVLVLGRAIAFV